MITWLGIDTRVEGKTFSIGSTISQPISFADFFGSGFNSQTMATDLAMLTDEVYSMARALLASEPRSTMITGTVSAVMDAVCGENFLYAWHRDLTDEDLFIYRPERRGGLTLHQQVSQGRIKEQFCNFNLALVAAWFTYVNSIRKQCG